MVGKYFSPLRTSLIKLRFSCSVFPFVQTCRSDSNARVELPILFNPPSDG